MKAWMTAGVAATVMALGGCAALDGTTISLAADTYFASGSAALKPSSRAELASLANRIKLNALTINGVRVEGNTDNIGGTAYNLDLSKRRAVAVVEELVRNGVPRNLISAYGNGEAKPVASNSTENGRAANRRVDVIIKGRLLF